MPLTSPENARWRLKQVHTGKIFDVNGTDNYMVGRSQTAQISLNSNKTSRTHSSFVVNVEGHLLVQDLKSVNGTFVNGTQIAVYVLHRLFPGDIIGFGVPEVDISENDRDKQTFFIVLYEEPPVQDIPPIANLADSTTDSREHLAVNLIDSSQSPGRNSTADTRINSHFDELPSTSDVKKDFLEIIEITSSTGDEEKPDVDFNDYFEGGENMSDLQNLNVPERSPEKTKNISNNWLQKIPSPKRPFGNKRSSNGPQTRSGGNNKNVSTSKQATNSIVTSDCENRKHKICDLSVNLDKKGIERNVPSSSKENVCDTLEKDNDCKKSTRNKKIDDSQKINLDSKQTSKGLNDKQKSLDEKYRSYLKSYLHINDKKAEQPVGISVRRKSSTISTGKDNEDHSKNIKDSLRRKSIAEECSYIRKDLTTKNQPVVGLKLEKHTSISIRRKSLAVSYNEKEDNDHPKKTSNCVLRRKSIAGEPSYTQKDVISETDRHNKQHGRFLYKFKDIEISPVPSKRPGPKALDTVGNRKKDEGEPSSNDCLRKKSFASDIPHKTKETGTSNSKQTEESLAKKMPRKRKSIDEKSEVASAKIFSGSSVVLGSDDDRGKKKNKEPNNEKLLKIPTSFIKNDLILQLEQAIPGNDDLSYKKDLTIQNSKKLIEKTENFGDQGSKKYDKKQDEEKKIKLHPSSKHKKVKIDDREELIFNNFISPRDKDLRQNPRTVTGNSVKSKNTKNLNSSNDLILRDSTKELTSTNSKDVTKESKDDYNEQKKLAKDSSVHNVNFSNNNRSGERNVSSNDLSSKNIKSLEKSFTTEKDNSVIIDITDEDEEMDFSCSQIFHMSQIVKLEAQDDAFQKIKNELAEMDFCEEETIINAVPINLENDMSGFENTQDICACLEEGVEESTSNGNFISNEENEELLKILEESDKHSDNKNSNPGVEDIEILSDVSTALDKNNQNKSAPPEEDKFIEKPKFVKPPIIEPHTIVKPKKDFSKKSLVKQGTNVNNEEKNTKNNLSKEKQSNKRKNSLETPTTKKKLKGSPRSVEEPPRCDTKSIQIEFKKRNSGSKVDHDSTKVHKENIREARRKKLKEISERSTPSEATGIRGGKATTVKVLPESKTRRGSFLCEEPKKNSDDIKSKFNRGCSGSKGPAINKSPKATGNSKNDVKKSSKNSKCKCNEPGSSGYQVECSIHAISLSKSGENLDRSFDYNYDRQSLKVSDQRSKTPNKDLLNYKLKPIDLPEPTVVLSKYNLRRTKSSGDIKADSIKSGNQVRSTQSRYNLRHSTALDNTQKINQDLHKNSVIEESNQGDSRTSRFASRLPPASSTFRPPYVNQMPQYAVPPQINQVNTTQTVSYSAVSRATHDLSRRLMWTNGGPSTRRPPLRRLPGVEEVVQKMVHWLPNWLTEQVNIDYSAPVNNPPATTIPLNFKNHEQYYNTFSKLVLLENWQYLFKGFREGAEFTRKVKIEHVRVANDLMTLDCVCYITQQELRQGLFYKLEDFVLLECVVNDKSNSYMSLNFGLIQRCKKSIISNNDVISIRCSFCLGEPHTKLEFSILTRYQPDKEINKRKFPLVKLLANIRAHLMLVRAIKMLVDSPICSKILHPKINEYRFSVTHRDIIHPHSLNTQQKSIVLEAASLCTGKDPGIYCIKGPPGTGKSTVIVHLLFQILFSHYVTKKTKEPPMILLAAPSNTAVDNLLAKLTTFKHSLGSEWDKCKANIKCVRIGPEASINKELAGYSLPKLAEKHMPIKHMDVPEFKAARERNENLLDFSRVFFGDRYGYEIKACEDLIIEKSNIICTTLNSCINGKLIEAVNRGLIKFSCCIIDEATQCHEVEALLPTILGIDKLVLVGDPKQLNATIMNRDAFKLGFGESLFNRIANNFTTDPRTPIKMLTDQYRMHEEICAFPNKQFYEGKLRSLPEPPNKLPDKIRPYLVFNCEKVIDSNDYTNIEEVNLIKVLLSTLLGLIDRNHKYTVGIISPYNAQKDLINRNIADLVSKTVNCKITVNTVDSFQGSENDIIIISCVRDSTNSFLQNENRLNVALTRAKQALYIIGSYTLFKECRTLYDLREDAKKRRLLLDIRQDPMTVENFSKYLLKKSSKK